MFPSSPPSRARPSAYADVPFFGTLRRWQQPAARRLLLGWLLASALVVPTSMATRLFEWTGIPFTVGGVQMYISVYIPLLFCVACVMWLGYAWAAIPAYFATAAVASLAGMPPEWVAVFSFSNPLGLAVYALAYRAFPMRTDLRSGVSVAFYVLVSLVSALVGSAGSFLWGYTNSIGVDALLPVWQGWWMGGFVQAVGVNGLLLYAAGPSVERWKTRHGWSTMSARTLSRPRMLAAFGVVVVTVVGYVLLARHFSYHRLGAALENVADARVRASIAAAIEGLTLVQWVMLLMVVITSMFWYTLAQRWTHVLRTSRDAHRRLNAKLQAEVETRQHAETELRTANEQLHLANASKDRFFSIVAHDLRSPLASIVSVSGLLMDDIEDMSADELKSFVGMMNHSATSLYAFLDNLLTWAHLQTGGMQYRPAWIDPSALVGSAAGLLGSNAWAKGIEFGTTIEPGWEIEADENMMRSVVLNLVSNALKFTPEGGRVHVSAAAEGDRLRFVVRDTGHGMTAEQLGKLFRVDTAFTTAGTSQEKGSGLGLILCHEMIARHGSSLTVASEPGQGTAFTFDLAARPAASSDGAPAHGAAHAGMPVRPARRAVVAPTPTPR